jgi:hypothetical protein
MFRILKLNPFPTSSINLDKTKNRRPAGAMPMVNGPSLLQNSIFAYRFTDP